jgi:hypothetical protein
LGGEVHFLRSSIEALFHLLIHVLRIRRLSSMPITAGEILVRLFVVGLFFRGLAALFAFLLLGASGTALHAQTIRIKLVNGRNGRAMAGTCVNVWVGNEGKSAVAIPTDNDRVASLRLTDKDAEINTQNQWKGCGDFGVVNPVVKYDRSVRTNAGYVLCQVRQPDHPWLAIQSFSIEQVLQFAVVTANVCGKATTSP